MEGRGNGIMVVRGFSFYFFHIQISDRRQSSAVNLVSMRCILEMEIDLGNRDD